MRAHFRGDRPFHGRDLEGGHNAPPPPPAAYFLFTAARRKARLIPMKPLAESLVCSTLTEYDALEFSVPWCRT